MAAGLLASCKGVDRQPSTEMTIENASPDSLTLENEMLRCFRSKDTTEFTVLIRSSALPVRKSFKRILTRQMLGTHLSEHSVEDFTRECFEWLEAVYARETGLTDIDRLQHLYSAWTPEQTSLKIHLDSVYDYAEESIKSDRLLEYSERLGSLRDSFLLIEDSFLAASMDYRIALRFYEHGEVDSCRIYSRRALATGQSLDFYDLIGDCHLLFGNALSYTAGQYEDAELEYQAASVAFRRARSPERMGFVFQAQGYTRLMLARPFEAIESYRSGAEYGARFEKTKLLTHCVNNLADCFCGVGQFDSALRYAQKALSISQKGSQTDSRMVSQRAYTESTLGRAYAGAYLHDEALEHYRRADSLFSSIGDREGSGVNDVRLGSLFVRAGDIVEARKHFEMALAASDQPEVVIESVLGRALCQSKKDSLGEALSTLKSCIGLVKYMQGQAQTGLYQSGVASDKIKPFLFLATLYLAEYRRTAQLALLDSALLVLESSRSLELAEALRAAGIPQRPQADSVLSAISLLNKRVLLGQVDSATYAATLSWLEDSLSVIQIRESRANPAATSGYTEAIDGPILRTLLANLGNSDVVLEYLLTPYGCFVIALTRDSSSVYELGGDSEHLDSLVRGYIAAINSKPGIQPPDYRTAGERLYECLVPESLSTFIANRALVIIPSGSLYLLPFEALIASDGQFLVEKWQIRYAPALSSLNFIQQRKRRSRPGSELLVVGDIHSEGASTLPALRYSQSELASIRTMYGSKSTLFMTGAAATESAFKSHDFARTAVVHISAHGILDQVHPERSFIQMSPSLVESDDARLRPDEIRRLRLPGSLVFLSACETAAGQIDAGEGALSLSRNFLMGGSNAVIATLWQVDDRFAGEFTGRFYALLSKGADAQASLTSAKRMALEHVRPLYRHPYYWSPFVLVGG